MRPILETQVLFFGVRPQLPTEVPLIEGGPVQAAPVEPVVEAAVDAAPVAEVAPVVEAEPAAEIVAEAEEPVAEADEVIEKSTPTWNSTMTKAELLVVVQQLGLSVTSANTKAEILAALDATKQ